MAHPRIYKPCEHCGASFTLKGKQSVEAQTKARFCSKDCHAASGWRNLVCQCCSKTFKVKANIAATRRYCSQQCMFEARRCLGCGRLTPTERMDQGYRTCSERCDLILILEQEQTSTGVIAAPCGGCKRMLPTEAFTKSKATRNGLNARCKDCVREYYQGRKDDYRLRRYIYDAAPGGIVVLFSAEQKAARFSLWGGRCWICGIADATQDDHVKPISKGGSHCLANLRPICQSCNASKGGRWPLPPEALQPRFKHPAPRSGSGLTQVTARQPRVDWQCGHCQSVVNLRAFDARKKKYCSKQCANDARDAAMITFSCQNPSCDRTFKVPDQRGTRQRKFCTIECAWVARNRPAHWGPANVPQPTLF